MLFNDILYKGVTKNDERLWCKAMDTILSVAQLMHAMPKRNRFRIECHTICRALGLHIPELKVVDGFFLGLEPLQGKNEFEIKNCDHSWLTTPDLAIIDPYPVGFMTTNPVLIGPKGVYAPYGKELYVPQRSVTNRVVGRGLYRKTNILFRYIKEAEAKDKAGNGK